ncbi:MAG: hypothetical protein V7K88_20625, partial [Nostoc sp.]|uniref:WD40 repeat domain-containing protein n=1 Tax=Nostoc sp. TaxID=1180 RepID=UPI002FF91921
ASFSPDGQRILTASEDNTARLWDLQGKEIAKFQGRDGGVISASFSRDGQHILSASLDKTQRVVSIYVWNVESLEQLLARGCRWLHNYLIYAPNLRDSDRQLCNKK